MTHAVHQGTRRVLGDDCDECLSRAGTLNGLSELDSGNLKELAELAQEIHDHPGLLRPQDLGASYADRNAVETLRLAARITFRSGISQAVAE